MAHITHGECTVSSLCSPRSSCSLSRDQPFPVKLHVIYGCSSLRSTPEYGQLHNDLPDRRRHDRQSISSLPGSSIAHILAGGTPS